jgi:transcriptional regulator with XRE-family HTH domain
MRQVLDYNKDHDEFDLLRNLVIIRKKLSLTQAKVAETMGTKASAIARLESALSGKNKYTMPTIQTLKKYAQAVGCNIEMHLVPSSVLNDPIHGMTQGASFR